jgi:kynurenine formamidase
VRLGGIGPWLALLSALFVAGCASGTERWVDLSWSYSEDTVFWPTNREFEFDVLSAGVTEKGYYYASNDFAMAEHGGTHVDAPRHFSADGLTVDQIPIERLMGPAVVIDVRNRAMTSRNLQIGPTDFMRFETQHGRIPDGAVVLLRTGFGQYWPDPVAYLGTALRGPEGVAELSFPGLHPAGAEWLVTERDVTAVGIDTASIDFGRSTHFETHQVLAAAQMPIFENVAHLDSLPPTGAWVVALPLKIEGGSGGPIRIVAHLPSGSDNP